MEYTARRYRGFDLASAWNGTSHSNPFSIRSPPRKCLCTFFMCCYFIRRELCIICIVPCSSKRTFDMTDRTNTFLFQVFAHSFGLSPVQLIRPIWIMSPRNACISFPVTGFHFLSYNCPKLLVAVSILSNIAWVKNNESTVIQSSLGSISAMSPRKIPVSEPWNLGTR